MIEFRQFITEVFDKVYPYHNIVNYPKMVYYGFETENNRPGKVLFDKVDSNIWELNFTIQNSASITGGGDAFKIFSTVIKILEEFLNKYDPEILVFSALKVLVGNSAESRIDLYRAMLKKKGKQAGYDFMEDKESNKSTFVLTRSKN